MSNKEFSVPIIAEVWMDVPVSVDNHDSDPDRALQQATVIAENTLRRMVQFKRFQVTCVGPVKPKEQLR